MAADGGQAGGVRAAADRSRPDPGEGWTDTAALGITHLLSPPALALAVFLWLPAGDAPLPSAWGKALAILLFSIGPAVLLGSLARGGDVADIYDPPRHLRRRFLLVGTLCYAVGFAVLQGLQMPPAQRWAAASFAVGAAGVGLVNRWWKISIHGAGSGGAAVVGATLLGAAWWPLCAFLPLAAAWARRRRGAHSPAQLVAGTGLGAAVTLLLRAALM